MTEPDPEITGDGLVAVLASYSQTDVALSVAGEELRAKLIPLPTEHETLDPGDGSEVVVNQWRSPNSFETKPLPMDVALDVRFDGAVLLAVVGFTDANPSSLVDARLVRVEGEALCATRDNRVASPAHVEIVVDDGVLVLPMGQVETAMIRSQRLAVHAGEAFTWSCNDEEAGEGITTCGRGQLIIRALAD